MTEPKNPGGEREPRGGGGDESHGGGRDAHARESRSGGTGASRSGIDRDALRAYESGEDLTDGGKYGPLGAGHDPDKDPMKGLRGVMAGTLVMQAISVLLGLTVVLRVDGGSLLGPTPSAWYIGIFGLVLLVMSGMQGRPWALKVDLALQVVGVLAFITHWSMGLVGLFFAAVWLYILSLRKNLIARMEKGLLTTQHT